jgi:hypothetical protein
MLEFHPTTLPKVCFFVNLFLIGFDVFFGMYGLALFGVLCCAVCLLGWQLRARGY